MVLSGDKEKVSAGFVPAFSSHTSLREWVIGRLDKHKQTTTGVILGHGRLILWYRWPRGGHWNMWLCFTHSQSWQCSGISDFFFVYKKFKFFEWTIQKTKMWVWLLISTVSSIIWFCAAENSVNYQEGGNVQFVPIVTTPSSQVVLETDIKILQDKIDSLLKQREYDR